MSTSLDFRMLHASGDQRRTILCDWKTENSTEPAQRKNAVGDKLFGATTQGELQPKRSGCMNNLLDIPDPVFELSTPPTQRTSFVPEPSVQHFCLLASSVMIVMGPAPPKDVVLSERKYVLPGFITSRTAGLFVPHDSGKGPVAYPWEVQDERWV